MSYRSRRYANKQCNTEDISYKQCEESEISPDYESLLANLRVVGPLMDCDPDTKNLACNTAAEILTKLFDSGNDGCHPCEWFDVSDSVTKDSGAKCVSFYSCFDEKCVTIKTKDGDEIQVAWKPRKTPCIEKAICLAECLYDCPPCTFKEIIDILVLYLVLNLKSISYENAQLLYMAICELLRQRVRCDRLSDKAKLESVFF